MIEKSAIKKMANRLKRSRPFVVDRQIMHPEREWFIGLLIGLALLIAGSVWSFYTYMEYQDTSISDNQEAEIEVVYRAALVQTALEDFEARRKSYEDLKNSLLNLYGLNQLTTPEVQIEPIETPVTTEEVVNSDIVPIF